MSATQVIHRAGAPQDSRGVAQRALSADPLVDCGHGIFGDVFIRETLDILEGNDRAYIKEILLLVSPRASEESFAICRERAARNPRVKILVQKNNPGIGWAYREGMEAAAGNYVALMAAELETEPAAVRVAGAAQPKRFLAGHHEEACIPVSSYQGSARHCGGVLCVPV